MPEDFDREHEGVFAEARNIFRRRSQVRGQMWLDTTIEREFTNIEEKLERARRALDALRTARERVEGESPTKSYVIELENEFDDSLLDLMNFANFAIKKERRQRDA